MYRIHLLIHLTIVIIVFFSSIIWGLPAISDDLSSETKSKPALESEKPFLGVYLNPRDNLESYGEKYSGKKGLHIPVVLYQSAAEKAGIQRDDVIVTYDNQNFDSIQKSKMLETFRNYIRDDKKINEQLHLKILRKKHFYYGKKQTEIIPETQLNPNEFQKRMEDQLPGETITITIEKEVSEITITACLGRKPHMRNIAPPDNAELYPEYENQTDDNIQTMNQLIHDYQLNDAYEDLIQRLSDDEWWDDGFRTRFFRYAHRSPQKFPLMASNLVKRFENSVEDNTINAFDLYNTAANLMDVDAMAEENQYIDRLALSCGQSITHFFHALNDFHQILLNLHQQTFSALSETDMRLLNDQTPIIMKRFVDHYYLDIGANIQEMEHHRKISVLAKNIQYSYLYRASYLLQQLSNSDLLTSLHLLVNLNANGFDERPEKLGISGDVLCIKQFENNYFVIGGPGFTKYTRPLDWIIDLGGDDLYLDNAGAAKGDKKVSVVIDLNGNDQYSSTEQWSQGAGFMGFGIVIDKSGNDCYTAKSSSQGCGVMGVGHLIDLSGNDQYYGQEFHQGVSFWGIGSLIDCNGNDYYHSSLFSQAVGGTYGLGLLIDCKGDDRYFATGKHKSSYETDGIFRGSSQGFGIGFRGISSGGIGILIDMNGSDQMMAGNFSQGGGYFFGLGILKNAGINNDLYVASRYGQGFSAHSAAGILIDEGGDDIYKGSQGAVQSAAWDLGIAALVDHSGNDQYHAGLTFFSQGAAAHNGFSMFLDLNGSDQYLSDPSGIARAQSNDYHNGNSLGFFIDKGGQQDSYEKQGLNNFHYMNGEYSIFMDK